MKRKALVSFMTFIPTIVGIISWNYLPNVMPIHFNNLGIDGVSNKYYVVFLVPFMFFILSLVYNYIQSNHPDWIKAKSNTKVNYLFPILSILTFVISVINA